MRDLPSRERELGKLARFRRSAPRGCGRPARSRPPPVARTFAEMVGASAARPVSPVEMKVQSFWTFGELRRKYHRHRQPPRVASKRFHAVTAPGAIHQQELSKSRLNPRDGTSKRVNQKLPACRRFDIAQKQENRVRQRVAVQGVLVTRRGQAIDIDRGAHVLGPGHRGTVGDFSYPGQQGWRSVQFVQHRGFRGNPIARDYPIREPTTRSGSLNRTRE